MTLLFDVVLVCGAAAQSEGIAVASLPGSARSAGLRGAAAALLGDAGAVFANPAGIATIRRVSLEGSYERYLGGTVLSSAAVAARAGRFGWGLGAHVLDYGSEAVVVPDPATGGRRGIETGATFRATDLVAVAALVYRVGLIAVGTSAKFARQQIGDWSADAWGGDAGLAIALFDIMALAASVQNLGGDLGGGARLPRRTRVGFILNHTVPESPFRLLTIFEGQWPAGGRGRGSGVFVAGVEAGVVTRGVGLVARAGYGTRPAAHDASRLSAGGGVELGRLYFDYAYQGYDALGGGTHRVGLRWTP